MVTRRSAKPPCEGSIPSRTSSILDKHPRGGRRAGPPRQQGPVSTHSQTLVRERSCGPITGQLCRCRFPSGKRRHGHGDLQRVVAAAEQDAAQRADVAVVAAPGERHVALGRQHVVGGIEIDPSEPRTPDREPGVRRVGADQPRLAGRRVGQRGSRSRSAPAAPATSGSRSAGARSPGRRRGDWRARASPASRWSSLRDRR